MDTQTILIAGAALCLIAYLFKRRARLKDED
jgi:hypothetical protein